MEQSTTLPVGSSSSSSTPTSPNDNLSILNNSVNQNQNSLLPPPPPNHDPHQQSAIDAINRYNQLDSKLNEVLDLFSQLSAQLPSPSTSTPAAATILLNNSSPISNNNRSSSIGIKRELTPHSSLGQISNSNSALPPFSPVPVTHQSAVHAVPSNRNNYNGLVKFPLPPFFSAKPEGDQQMALLNFFSGMNRYLAAVHIDPHSFDSLNVAAMRLSDHASQWYDFTMERQPELLTSWYTLKEAMKKRYQPIAQSQLAFTSLLNVRYSGSIEKVNYEFLKYLQLLPEYNNGQSESVMIGIYMNALTQVSGTTYICTTLRNAIAQEEISTLAQVQSMALLAESNLGKNVKSTVPYVPPHHRSSSSSSSHRFSNNNSNNQFRSSNSSFKSNFNRASVPSPSFSTPVKLHNVHVENDSNNQQVSSNTNDHYNQAANDYENELSETGSSADAGAGPSFHEDNSNENDEQEIISENDIAFLHAMRLHDYAKKVQPSLTTDEIDRRRRSGTCFKCNRPGHYANKCLSSASSSSSSFQSKKQ